MAVEDGFSSCTERYISYGLDKSITFSRHHTLLQKGKITFQFLFYFIFVFNQSSTQLSIPCAQMKEFYEFLVKYFVIVHLHKSVRLQ